MFIYLHSVVSTVIGYYSTTLCDIEELSVKKITIAQQNMDPLLSNYFNLFYFLTCFDLFYLLFHLYTYLLFLFNLFFFKLIMLPV